MNRIPGMLPISEKDLQRTIIDAARRFGWLVAHRAGG